MSAVDPQAPAGVAPRRRGLFWPVALIAIGLVFLLANYGLIQPLSVLSLLALWPVLLILLGIDIAFARRWPLPTLAAEVAIIALAIVFAATQPGALGLGALTFGRTDCAGQPSVSAPRGSASSLALRINGGAARYRIEGGARELVEATSDRDLLCLTSRANASSRGDVVISQSGTRIGGSADVSVKVANDVPLSLTMNAGAGDFLVDLHDVKVTEARFAMGAASTTLVLPHPAGDVTVRIDGGASSVTIEIPADVEARVTVSGGLVSSSSSNPRATKDGNIIQTTGYAGAKDRVTVTVTGGASSVVVR